MSTTLLEKPKTYELGVVPNGGVAKAVTPSGEGVIVNVYNVSGNHGDLQMLGELAGTGSVHLLYPTGEKATHILGERVYVKWR